MGKVNWIKGVELKCLLCLRVFGTLKLYVEMSL
jgi:hypothetical protein